MEGIMGHHTSSSVHDAFSRFHLKSECEECRAASEADKISLEKRLSEVIKERDEARAQADHFKAQAFDVKNKHEDIQSVCAGLVKSKSGLSSKHESDWQFSRAL
ncbi:hypothetical protein LIER_35407 [Lithospermum erythrorhizon]|uniref:Uncharacterized protein n=1 Tax=Lithospermum erythrorhizon TaxID=34254 RepID=A0AAV3NRE9_LITER